MLQDFVESLNISEQFPVFIHQKDMFDVIEIDRGNHLIERCPLRFKVM